MILGRVLAAGSGKESLVYWEQQLHYCLISVSTNWLQNLGGLIWVQMSVLGAPHSWCPGHLVHMSFDCFLFHTITKRTV